MNVNISAFSNFGTIEMVLGRCLSAFPELGDAEITALAVEVEVKRYDRGSQFIAIGDTQPYIFMVADGLVRKFFAKNQEEYTVEFAKEGNIIIPFRSYFYE